jgi:hypothetical protein
LLLFGFIFPLLVHVFLVTQEPQSLRFDFYINAWFKIENFLNPISYVDLNLTGKFKLVYNFTWLGDRYLGFFSFIISNILFGFLWNELPWNELRRLRCFWLAWFLELNLYCRLMMFQMLKRWTCLFVSLFCVIFDFTDPSKNIVDKETWFWDGGGGGDLLMCGDDEHTIWRKMVVVMNNFYF